MKTFYFKSYNRNIWHVIRGGKPLCNCHPGIGRVKESLSDKEKRRLCFHCEKVLNND